MPDMRHTMCANVIGETNQESNVGNEKENNIEIFIVRDIIYADKFSFAFRKSRRMKMGKCSIMEKTSFESV